MSQAPLAPEVIELLGDDRVWPWLLIEDQALVGELASAGVVPMALAEGRDAALVVRRTHPEGRARDVLAALEVPIVYSAQESRVSWRHPRSSYQQDPPQVEVFQQAIPALTELAERAGLLPGPAPAGPGARSPEDLVLDVLLAHELYHHLALTSLGRVSARHRLRRRVVGPVGRWVEVPVLDELGAHAFVREFCRLRVTTVILDLLTIYRSPERFDDLVRRARSLRDGAA